ncbi:MAG: LacI family DNA-binding transcriptional regulator [Butyricicoccaceae bacterium]
MKPTVRSIAELAGVSRGTVSRVLNNQPNVNPKVRARVQKIIEETGYRPAKPTSEPLVKIGVLLPFWHDEYFTRQTMEGIRRAQKLLRAREVELIICQMDSRSDEEYIRRCEEMAQQGVQGIALNASDNYPICAEVESLTQRGIKVVTYNSDIPGSSRICHVGQDVMKSGRIAAGLMARDVRPGEQILIVTGNLEFPSNRLRIDGYIQRLLELGFSERSYHLVESFEDEELTYHLVKRALKTPHLRGIYMASESVRGCVRALEDWHAPLSLICNDLTPFARRQLKKGRIDFIIEQDFPTQIYEALLVLAQILLYHRPIHRAIRYVDTSIVTRESL